MYADPDSIPERGAAAAGRAEEVPVPDPVALPKIDSIVHSPAEGRGAASAAAGRGWLAVGMLFEARVSSLSSRHSAQSERCDSNAAFSAPVS